MACKKMDLPKATKRGYGACPEKSCGKVYATRRKPKYCECGFFLGGSFDDDNKRARLEIATSVVVYERKVPQKISIRSVQTSRRDTRQFAVCTESNKICFVDECKSLRSTYKNSEQLQSFSCSHLSCSPVDPIYSCSFTAEEISGNIPDKQKQQALTDIQEMGQSMLLPSVVKVSAKTYAVLGDPSASQTLGYVHVSVIYDGTKKSFHCLATECKKPYGRTKQVNRKRACTHLHFVALALKLRENIHDSVEQLIRPVFSKATDQDETAHETRDQHRTSTLKLQNSRCIPYQIPPEVIAMPDSISFDGQSDIPTFQTDSSQCGLCNGLLGDAHFPQGCSSSNGNGILLSHKHPFKRVNIKIKKCSNLDCGAKNNVFPYQLGLFNACNKVLVSFEILLDWREYFKEGFPVTNVIEAKLRSASQRVEKSCRPSDSEFEYLVDVLYNGFYAFEALTDRDLDDTICGICGTVGEVYLGDGNEKNCCGLSEIELNDAEGKGLQKLEGSTHLESTLQDIRMHILEKATFAKSKQQYKIKLQNIPPIIPAKQRKFEINTEREKKSVYLKSSEVKVEGDAMMLSNAMRKDAITTTGIDSMNRTELLRLAELCKIRTAGKSNDMLKHDIQQLYATILVGTSACHGFTKSVGHTGGFYHLVCRHGCTVASKFLILTESVRDAADLYLSLRTPPKLFICDTACTFVQHMNNREPELSRELWGELDGCFEIPDYNREPTKNMNVPDIVPLEYSDGSRKDVGNGIGQVHVMGDRFHSSSKPHKSPLCAYHDINLCMQANSVKTSYQESENNRKNKKRLRSSCMQSFHIHFFYNYLMDFYQNEKIVAKQRKGLEKNGLKVKRDDFMRFVF